MARPDDPPAAWDRSIGSDDVDVRRSNERAVRELASLVGSTLGPNGRDKMLVGSRGTVVVTNDGSSILRRLEFDHPAAEVALRIANEQDRRFSDGSTTAVLLLGELLAEGESLREDGLHPTTIAAGYGLAVERAAEALRSGAVPVTVDDADLLESIARTAITGRWDDDSTAFLADLAVRAVRASVEPGRPGNRSVVRKGYAGGAVRDSELIDGLVIDLGESSTSVVGPEPLPRRIEDASIALVDGRLTVDTPSGMGAMELDSADALEELRAYEREAYETHAERIADAGADVVLCQKSIDDPVRHLLARRGVLAVERTRRDEFHRLERATGAAPVAGIDELTPASIGRMDVLERRTLGRREVAVIRSRSDDGPLSLLLVAGTEHVADELERIADDCLGVLTAALEEGRAVPGAGAAELGVADALRSYAATVPDRSQLAIEAVADALEAIPRILARNAGGDPVAAVPELRAARRELPTAGFDVRAREPVDALEAGILEPLAVKRRAIAGAAEAASALLRIDDAIETAGDAGGPEGDSEHEHEHDHGGVRRDTGGYPWAIGH